MNENIKHLHSFKESGKILDGKLVNCDINPSEVCSCGKTMWDIMYELRHPTQYFGKENVMKEYHGGMGGKRRVIKYSVAKPLTREDVLCNYNSPKFN